MHQLCVVQCCAKCLSSTLKDMSNATNTLHEKKRSEEMQTLCAEHTHTHTHRNSQTGPITIHCAAACAQCNHLHYADNTVLIADSPQKLQSLLDTANCGHCCHHQTRPDDWGTEMRGLAGREWGDIGEWYPTHSRLLNSCMVKPQAPDSFHSFLHCVLSLVL